MALRIQLHGLTPAPLDFVLTSGHNAGIVSEPGHPRAATAVWRVRRRPHADAGRVAAGRARACDGSWWPAWASWLAGLSGKPRKPPALGAPRRYPVLADAPGACPGEEE